MKKSLSLLLLAIVTNVSAQVGIGTSSPDASAALEVTSTSQGLLPPRMTAVQRNSISNPAQGLIVYCTDCGTNGELQIFNGTEYTNIIGGARTLSLGNNQVGSDLTGEASDDEFGRAVAISHDGTVIAVGAPNNDGNGTDAGHVRVFEYSSGNWTQRGGDIDGEANDDLSGCTLAMSSDGNTVAIGAHKNDGNGTEAGHVRVYEYTSGNWVQKGSDIDGEASEDWFGGNVQGAISLSADGSILAVGAYKNDGNGTDAGHVRVFEFTNGSWGQIGSDLDGEAAGDLFGYALDLSDDGNVLIIGGLKNDGNGSDAGHVQVYEYSSGTWNQKGIDIDGEASGDGFGYSVSINGGGDTIAVGAIYNSGNQGYVRIYEYSSNAWNQIGSDIDNITSGSSPLFGFKVSISRLGNKFAASAINTSGGGTVRVFELINNDWQQSSADISGDSWGNQFGFSIELTRDGSNLVVGCRPCDYVRIFTELSGGL